MKKIVTMAMEKGNLCAKKRPSFHWKTGMVACEAKLETMGAVWVIVLCQNVDVVVLP